MSPKRPTSSRAGCRVGLRWVHASTKLRVGSARLSGNHLHVSRIFLSQRFARSKYSALMDLSRMRARSSLSARFCWERARSCSRAVVMTGERESGFTSISLPGYIRLTTRTINNKQVTVTPPDGEMVCFTTPVVNFRDSHSLLST